MAIYHLSVKPVSRGGGRSATAAAAYRSAELVHDLTTDEVFDYTRKQGVEHREILLPTRCAGQEIHWARDRQQLWNAAEQAENRSNSRVAREYELALPEEMTHAQRLALTRDFSQHLADRYGVAVDIAIHAPHRHGDQRNHHAHLLTTTRTIEPEGLGAKSEIEWSDTNRQKAGLVLAKDEITLIRARWAELANEHLQEHSLEARIDHRSLAHQGLERQPTHHLGPAVSGMQRRGLETQVELRIRQEQRLAMQQRLENAAELGRIERERQHVQESVLDLSGDLAGAKRARELTLEYGGPGDRLRQRVEQRADELQLEWGAERGLGQAHALAHPAPQGEQNLEQRLRHQIEQRAALLTGAWTLESRITLDIGAPTRERERKLALEQKLQHEQGAAPAPERHLRGPGLDLGL